VALTSLLTAASIAPLAAADGGTFVAYAVPLALLSGLIQLGFGLMRLGVLMNLLSHPVLIGFVNAAAILITLSQIPALLGVPPPKTGHALLDLWHLLERPQQAHVYSVLIGVAAIGLIAIANLRGLREARVPRIVYVSCNPASLVSDLESLAAVYRIRGIRPVDMFPRVDHLETISDLELRSAATGEEQDP